MKKENFFSLRQFLQSRAIAAGGLLAANTFLLDPEPLDAQTRLVASSDRVRFGMIGIGIQGSDLLKNAIRLPGVDLLQRGCQRSHKPNPGITV